MKKVIINKGKSFAKLNLFLHLINRNQDGHHLLQSLMDFLELYDEILISESNTLKINFSYSNKLSANTIPKISSKENTITKIIQLFEEEANVKARFNISIKKNIPIGSGLAGGSGNAAYILKFLQQYFIKKLTKEKELEIAMKVGCDVAACLHERTIFVQGIGEKITEVTLDLKNYYVLIIYPQILNNSDLIYKIFKNKNLEFSQDIKLPEKINMSFVKKQHNDLLDPAITNCSAISDILDFLKNNSSAVYYNMSGSGSACFGIFADKNFADAALIRAENFFRDKRYFIGLYPNKTSCVY